MEEKRQMDFADLNAYSRRQSYHHNLRTYQQKNKADIYKAWGEGKTSVMLQMPTGTGKTHLFASLIKDIQDYTYDHASATRQGIAKILILVHRIELIEQIQDTLSKHYGHSCGILSGQMKLGTSRNVIVASVQTLSRKKRLHSWEEDVKFDFIIIDEAHHSTADSYQRIRQAWPNAWLLGVTATPYRLNHQPFTDCYDYLILSDPVFRFIEQGYLCNYDYYSIRPDSSMQYQINHLKTDFDGDYDERAMEQLLNQDHIRSGILDAYERFAKGKKGIVYTINRKHNVMLAILFQSHGYRVAYIDSETPTDERKKSVADFKAGKLDIIFNVNIFSEGFDCPNVEFIQLARPTKSLSMYLQQVGRGFRTAKGKEKVLFLDNVGLYNRFGLPSARRHWKHHFEGREDWEDDSQKKHDPLEEHPYHEPDLTEGGEEMLKVYTSIEDTPQDAPDTTYVRQYPEPQKPQEPIHTTMDNNEEFILSMNHQQYDITSLSMDEMLQLLLEIEEQRQTGVINIAAIREQQEQQRRKHRLGDWIVQLESAGYSRDEIMAFLSQQKGNEADTPTSTQPQTTTKVGKGLYVITHDGTLIQEKKDITTFIKAITIADVQKVYEARIQTLKSYLVDRTPHPRFPNRSHFVKGYYIVVNHSNIQKAKLLQEISDKLNLDWTIGVNEENTPNHDTQD